MKREVELKAEPGDRVEVRDNGDQWRPATLRTKTCDPLTLDMLYGVQVPPRHGIFFVTTANIRKPQQP